MPAFSDIIGHENIKSHLKNAIRLGKISHAYILDGEEGMGKMMLASAFAKTLQCEAGGTRPCGKCRSCLQAESGNHPDIIRVTHEKPASVGVDDIRSKLCGDIMIRPYAGPWKIYIVDEAEKMTVQAQNALLKTIEEPPAYGIILLLSTNSELLLPTVLSRCVTLKLRPVSDALVTRYLMEEEKIPDYQAKTITAFAGGNIGKAKRLAGRGDFPELKEEVTGLLSSIEGMGMDGISDAVSRMADRRESIYDCLDMMTLWYRDVLLFKATRDVDGLIFQDKLNEISAKAKTSSYEGLQTILEAIEKARTRLGANVNFEITMELLLLTIKEN